jgi:hypothetical protein
MIAVAHDPVAGVAAAPDTHASLSREIEREINAGFAADGRLEPFRFFALEDAEGFYLGLAYDHWVAGGDSIVGLLHGLVTCYLHGPEETASDGVSARRYGPTYARLLRRQFPACVNALWGLPRLAASCRRAFRPRYAAPEDGYNAVALTRIGAADRARLDACASTWGITSHDLLLAIVLKGLSPLTMRRLQSPTRNEIAVASIVNIRRDLGEEASRACPYLASFRVSHRSRPTTCPCAIWQRRSTGKRVRSSSASATCRHCSPWGSRGFEWRFMSPLQRQRFFANTIPCAQGRRLEASIRLNGGAGRAPGLDYLRARVHRPLSPMVLAFAMVGDVINVGITLPHDGIPARCRGRYRCCYASIHQDALTMNRPVSLDLRALALTVAMCIVLALGGCATQRSVTHAPGSASAVDAAAAPRSVAIDPAVERRILALDPEHITENDVRATLALGPTPHIILVHGGVYGTHLLMMNFGKFLIGMGYVENKVRDPSDGAYSQSPFGNSERLAGEIAWYYERDGLRPMLIGHSQGGIQTVKILYELDGAFTTQIAVWNPDQRRTRGALRDRRSAYRRTTPRRWPVGRLCLGGRRRRHGVLVAVPLEHGIALASHPEHRRGFHRVQHRLRSHRPDRRGRRSVSPQRHRASPQRVAAVDLQPRVRAAPQALASASRCATGSMPICRGGQRQPAGSR